MALLVVKEQLTHFRIKKVNEEECKDPLAWWRTHEVHFSYVGFIARQIMGIVGFQIEAKRVFSIASICTNLWHFYLGMDNFQMLINIYKNWPNDANVGGSPQSMEKFMEMEKTLMDENEDVIASFKLLDMDESNYTSV